MDSVSDDFAEAEDIDRTGQAFFALYHPQRRAVLDQIASGRRTVTDIAAGMAISRQAVAKHLAFLRDAGLIVMSHPHGSGRPYTLVPGRLDELASWLHALATAWRVAESE